MFQALFQGQRAIVCFVVVILNTVKDLSFWINRGLSPITISFWVNRGLSPITISFWVNRGLSPITKIKESAALIFC